MRRPATVGRFLMVTIVGVAMSQGAALGLLFVYSLLAPVLYGRGTDLPPAGFGWLCAALAVAAVAMVSVQYARGELDEWETSRRRPGR